MVKITEKWLRTKFNKLRSDDADIRTWDKFSHAEQLSILDRIKLTEAEVPVVATTDGPTWIVITTARICWRSQSVSDSVAWNDIAQIQAPEVFTKSKLDVAQLIVTDVDGREHLLQTTPGKPLFIIWNLLLPLVRRRG